MAAMDMVLEEAGELKEEHLDDLKKARYIRLKNPWNLIDKQRLRLSELGKPNLKIKLTYLLKEAFRSFREYPYLVKAKNRFDQWFWWATHFGLQPVREFALYHGLGKLPVPQLADIFL
jgi:transposase